MRKLLDGLICVALDIQGRQKLLPTLRLFQGFRLIRLMKSDIAEHDLEFVADALGREAGQTVYNVRPFPLESIGVCTRFFSEAVKVLRRALACGGDYVSRPSQSLRSEKLAEAIEVGLAWFYVEGSRHE